MLKLKPLLLMFVLVFPILALTIPKVYAVKSFSYNTTWNYISAVGGTVDNPINFNDLWLADKDGTLLLRFSTTYDDNEILSLTTQIKASDYKEIPIVFSITNIVGNWTFIINGLNKFGNGISDSFSITSFDELGDYETNISFTSIDTDGIILTMDAEGSITFSIYQNQWGLVWKTENKQFTFDCIIVIGNSYDVTYFNDTNKQVTFSDKTLTYNGQALIEINDYTYLTFGNLISEILKTTKDGIQIFDETTSYYYTRIIRGYNNPYSQINLFSCSFFGDSADIRHYIDVGLTPSRIWNCESNGIIINCQTNLDLFNYINTKGFYGLLFGSSGGAYDRLTFMGNTGETIYLYLGYGINVTNLYSRGSSGIAHSGGITQDSYFINFDSDTWVINWDAGSTAKIWRQYTFNLITTYPNGTKMVNATVLISNSVQGIVFNGTTDSNGNIPEQILTMGFYNITGGSTIYNYNPFWINATSQDGQYIYYKSWDMHDLANWEIALLPLVVVDTETSDIEFVLGLIGLSFGVIGLGLFISKR